MSGVVALSAISRKISPFLLHYPFSLTFLTVLSSCVRHSLVQLIFLQTAPTGPQFFASLYAETMGDSHLRAASEGKEFLLCSVRKHSVGKHV